jgi:hypothetical protein
MGFRSPRRFFTTSLHYHTEPFSYEQIIITGQEIVFLTSQLPLTHL